MTNPSHTIFTLGVLELCFGVIGFNDKAFRNILIKKLSKWS